MNEMEDGPSLSSPSQTKNNKLSPLYQFVVSKHLKNRQIDSFAFQQLGSRDTPMLRHPQRTSLLIWCGAVLCMVFTLLLIFVAVSILVIFLVIQPKDPVFDTPEASITSILTYPPAFMDADITFLANFSNPNTKLDVRFEYLDVELFVPDSDNPIASQILDPFNQRPGEAGFVSIHLQPRSAHLPLDLAVKLQNQEQSNRVAIDIHSNFRVTFKLGVLHYTQNLHGKCKLEMTSPPNGFLLKRSCKISRW